MIRAFGYLSIRVKSMGAAPACKEWIGFVFYLLPVLALTGGALYWKECVYDRRASLDHGGDVSRPAAAPQEPPIPAKMRVSSVAQTPRSARPTQSFVPQYPYYTVVAERGEYHRKGFTGAECINHDLDRATVLSEHQVNYPNAISGCGPTAILDWVLWYQGSGLLPRYSRNADFDIYKMETFALIDREITQLRGHARTNSENDGTNTTEIIAAFSELVDTLSAGTIKLAFEIKPAPLTTKYLLEKTRSYRAVILILQIFDPSVRPFGGFHAVAVLRTDTEGTTSIANWGKYVQGSLVKKSDGQWFVPQDQTHPMKVISLLTLTPVRPSCPLQDADR